MAEDEHPLGPSIRRLVIEHSWRAGVGHIGSALSVADMVGAVFSVIGATSPADPDRDRFVLSKGHAALALYAALALVGTLNEDDLATFCADGTVLGVHPSHLVPGIDFSTGSLGQGLSMGVGAALAGRMEGSARRVIVLVSDAECNEGSIWEAAMFASQHRLANLTVLVDHNHQQAFGRTDEVLASSRLAERWAAFGWETTEVDGHDEAGMARLLRAPATTGSPRAIVAETVFGRGVSYMEHELKWHYLPMSPLDYEKAVAEVGASL
ncbi:MAG TPA: transketolase [Acidimicrobiales bacterium]|nr:transketolase [Acidimicrobiales bacterium]